MPTISLSLSVPNNQSMLEKKITVFVDWFQEKKVMVTNISWVSNTVQQYYCISWFTSFWHPLQLLFQNFSTFLKLPTSPLFINSQLPPPSQRKWPSHENSVNFLPWNLKSDFVCIHALFLLPATMQEVPCQRSVLHLCFWSHPCPIFSHS